MQWRLPSGPVRDLSGWMESAGCVIFDEDFGTLRIDGMSQWLDSHPVVLLNNNAPTDRRRLTLAHELGHLCLHTGELGVAVPEEAEQEANGFAAEFLMPADEIRSQLRNLTLGKLHDLKRLWQVSMQALVERGYQLNRVTASQRTALYKQLSARGWRKREPLSDVLVPEVPTLANQIGETLLQRGLTPEEVAVMVGLAPNAPHNPFLAKHKRLWLVESADA